MKPRRILETLQGSGLPHDPAPPLNPPPRPAGGQLCAGARWISIKNQLKDRGFTIVLIARPTAPIGGTLIVFRPGKLTSIKPLEARSRVELLAGRSTDYAPEFVGQLRVKRCGLPAPKNH